MINLRRFSKIKTAAAAALVVGLAVTAACDYGVPNYILTVILDDGIAGTPIAGRHEFRDLATVSYSYTPVDPRYSIEAYLNTTRKDAEGTITMFNNLTLTVRYLDIRGTWNVKMQWLESQEVNFDFSITLDGPDAGGGTFTDSRGFNGVWSTLRNTLTITWTDWSDFVLEGSVFDMNGLFTAEGFTGSWQATKSTSLRLR